MTYHHRPAVECDDIFLYQMSFMQVQAPMAMTIEQRIQSYHLDLFTVHTDTYPLPPSHTPDSMLSSLELHSRQHTGGPSMREFIPH